MPEFRKCFLGGLSSFYDNSKPSLTMILVQICFAGLNVLSKIALNQGMSHFVLVFYRHLFATIFTAPLAYILERKTRPKLTMRIFVEIFVCSLFGISLNHNFYYTGLTYTSATFSTALLNLVPAITFLMAIVFRMESLNIRSLTGLTKIVGTIVCVSGAMTMTFYKGIKIQLWPSPFNLSEYSKSNNRNEDLTKGSLLVVMGCICFSAWYIMQSMIRNVDAKNLIQSYPEARTEYHGLWKSDAIDLMLFFFLPFQTSISKKYPVQYSSTAITSFLATIQCAVITLIFERDHYGVWVLGWNAKLLTAIYSGVVASGVAFCLMTWCVEKKGPVYTTMFGPLVLIIVAILGSILLHEKFYLGSVIGAILIVVGLYIMLWSKRKELKRILKMQTTPSSISNTKESNGVEHKDDLINIQSI